jgi:hypothetical protein
MLTQILNEYRKSGGAVSLDALSRKLGLEKSALEGMLETLVRQGKLRETTAPSFSCGGCHGGSCAGCGSHKIFASMGKSYEPVG